MKTLSLAEAKTHFSAILRAVIIPYETWKSQKKGNLAHWKERLPLIFQRFSHGR
jgi:hypothetical protein